MAEEKSSFLCLVSLRSPNGERTHLIERSPFVIGRAQESDIIYAHSSASRKHIEVSFDQYGIRLKDKDSANGTYYEDVRIDPETEIEIKEDHAVKIGLGEELIYFDLIQRPMELLKPEAQKLKIISSMDEVMTGLINNARHEYETKVKAQLEAEKRRALENAEKELYAQKQKLVEQIDTEIAKYREEQNTIFLKSKEALDSELKELQQRLEQQRSLIKSTEEQIAKNYADAKKQGELVISKSEETAKQLLTDAKNDCEQLKQTSLQQINLAKSNLEGEVRELQTKKEDLEKFINSSTEESKHIVTDAKNLANKLIENANSDAMKIVSEAKGIVSKMTTGANLESEKIISAAKLESENIINTTTQKMQSEFEEQKKKNLSTIENRKLELERELKSIENEIQKKSIEARTVSEKISNDLLSESRARIQKMEEEATEKAALSVRQGQAKLMEATKEASQKADQILEAARSEANSIRTNALNEINHTRQKAVQQADEIHKNAHADAEKYVQNMKAEQIESLQKEKDRSLKEIEELVRKKQSEIVNEFASKIEDLQTELQQSTAEVTSFKKNIASLEKSKDSLTNENAAIEKNIKRTKAEFEDLLQKVQDADLIIKKSETAFEEMKKSEEQHKNNLRLIASSDKKLEEMKAGLEAEYKRKQEQLIIEHDQKKRDLDNELNQQKLKSFDQLKQQIHEEEIKFRDTRKRQAAELSRSVELKLADRLQVYITDSEKMGAFSQDIYNVVKDVLANEETSLKPLTFHLDKSAVEKEQKRKKWILQATYASLAIALIIGYAFKDNLMSLIKAQDENSVAKQMIEQRKIQAKYSPEQTSEFRNNYVDNVIYMKYYAEIKQNSDYQNSWALHLSSLDTAHKLRLREDSMIKFIAIEHNMVEKLIEMRKEIDAVYLNEGIDRMRRFEEEERVRMSETLNNDPKKIDKIRQMEKEFLISFKNARKTDYPDTLSKMSATPSGEE